MTSSILTIAVLLLVPEHARAFLFIPQARSSSTSSTTLQVSRYEARCPVTSTFAAGAYTSLSPFFSSASTPSLPWGARCSVILQATKSKVAPTGAKGKSLAAEFERFAKEGQISFDAFLQTGEVSELLKDKLLAKAEIDDFWSGEAGGKEMTLDMEGYMTVHGMIDALFEDDEEEDEVIVDTPPPAAAPAPTAVKAKAGDVTLQSFISSGDVARYIEEGLVTAEEVAIYWKQVAGGEDVSLDRGASMEVYAKIEELLEEEEEEEEDDDVVVSAEDADLYADFKTASVGGKGKKMEYSSFLKAGDIPDLLAEDLVTRAELKKMWANAAKGSDSIDFNGYKAAVLAIDDLFEEADDDEEEEEEEEANSKTTAAAAASAVKQEVGGAGFKIDGPAKPQLMKLLSSITELTGWLEDDKVKDETVIALIDALKKEPSETNLAAQDDLELEVLEKAIEGEWDLVYTTSRTMRYNRGLSGLGSSLPKAEFLGFRQSISVNGYAYETIYTEKLKTLGRDLEVVVEGAWELRDVVSIMDGEVCLIMDVLPAQIKYGFITERLETGWKGVRVLNRCELLYLDDEIRIMKGQSSDSYFVFRRNK